jgi:adenosylcobinamide-phosphate synthase
MSLVSLILVLVLEQWRPLAEHARISQYLDRYATFLERQFNAGETHHGIIAWILALLPLLLVTGLLYMLAYKLHPLVALAFNVLVLYLTMGFRQASHYFTDIQRALKEGELDRARDLLGEWRGNTASALSRDEVVRVSIEQALIGAHRYVFGVAFWFAVLPGPIGAVLYRVGAYLAERWNREGEPELARFGWFAGQAFGAIDWLPARLTATAFAIVGNFEDAVYSWRTQAAQWADSTMGVVLAAGAGALGIRLGNPLHREDGLLDERPELGLGDEPDTPYLDSTVGLVWRALVFWLAMILIVTVVRALS